MRQKMGTTRGARIAVRLSREDRERIEGAVKARGFASPSAFIRAAIQSELNGRPELTESEDRIAGGFERVSRDNLRIVRGQQALHALLDTFVKTVLTCLPEPSIDAQPQAVARAKDRYHRLIKTAGQAMSGDALAALQDLVTHGTN
ncbi:MAG: ribbon-helix-helix domain-containing protein [Bryobacteraceae bacterium]